MEAFSDKTVTAWGAEGTDPKGSLLELMDVFTDERDCISPLL